MESQLAKRLKSKSVKSAIIGQISEAFNLTPLLAEAYFNQIKGYFLEHTDISLESGQLHYLAIDDREPAGKPVDLCRKVSVRLTVHNPEVDIERLYRDILAGEFHPLQYGKQTEAFGNHLLGNSIVA